MKPAFHFANLLALRPSGHGPGVAAPAFDRCKEFVPTID